MAGDDVLEYPDIAQEVKGAMNGGRLKLSKQGVLFKNNKTGIVEQIHSEDIEVGKWLRAARGYELKLFMKNGTVCKYDGFKDADREVLANFLKKQYSVELEDVELSIKGWNWGSASFHGSELDFKIGSKSAFNVPLGNVSHTTTGKNEVILEFHQNDDAEISLMEMRFYIPPSENNDLSLEQFHENIMAKADIIQATGDAITSLDQIPCLTPRGRYDIKIFPTFLQLHGKTFDYKIPYTTVLRLFLLPHKDQRQMLFVVSLDPPIVQGQTRYHFLIMSFSKEETISLDLNIEDEDLEKKYDSKLQKEMVGPLFEIVSRLLKALVARKITVPGSFKDSKGHQAITCSYKSNSGYLYPLERGFMYVHKPPIHVRFDEVGCVNFARGTGSTRYFDFEIERKNGDVFVFSSIEKDDYSSLYEFVRNKKLRVKNRGVKDKGKAKDYDALFDSDDEGMHDAYLEQMKAEGREKDDDGLDDSDSSSDEDFNPDQSASDVAEEYDSNPDPSSGSETGGTKSDEDQDNEGKTEADIEKQNEAKQKKKKEKKEAAEGKPKKKKKKKKKNEDPNKPKRPFSAYMIWLSETRPELKEKYPDFGVADIAKKAGEWWNKLENQDEWKEKATVLKEKYQEQMKIYNENRGDEPPEKKQKKKSKKPSTSSVSPKKQQGSFKSKEYISSEDSSASEKEKKKSKKAKQKEVKKEEVEEEEEEKKSEASEEEAKTSEKEEEKEEEDDVKEEVKEEEEEEVKEKEEEGDVEMEEEQEEEEQEAEADAEDEGSDD